MIQIRAVTGTQELGVFMERLQLFLVRLTVAETQKEKPARQNVFSLPKIKA